LRHLCLSLLSEQVVLGRTHKVCFIIAQTSGLANPVLLVAYYIKYIYNSTLMFSLAHGLECQVHEEMFIGLNSN